MLCAYWCSVGHFHWKFNFIAVSVVFKTRWLHVQRILYIKSHTTYSDVAVVFFSHTEIDDMIRKSTNLLLTRTLSGCLTSLIKKPNLSLLQVRHGFTENLGIKTIMWVLDMWFWEAWKLIFQSKWMRKARNCYFVWVVAFVAL